MTQYAPAHHNATCLTQQKGWRLVRIADVCEVATGGTPSTSHREYYNGDIPWLKSGDIKGIWIKEIPRRITRLGLENSNARVHPAGSVMLAMSGQGKTRGTSAVLRIPSACSQSIAAILPSPDVVPEFLHFVLAARYDVIRRLTGHNERSGLNLKIVRSIEIPLPPTTEQKRVAAYLLRQLDAVQHLSGAVLELRTAAQSLTGAFLKEIFESGAAKRWARRPLGEILEGRGQYGTSQKSEPVRVRNAVPVLGIANVRDGLIRWSPVKFGIFTPQELAKYRLERRDLLFCRTNSAELVGQTAVFDSEDAAAFASYLVRFRVASRIADPYFVSEYMNSPWGMAFIRQNMGRAIGQANVSASAVLKMPVPAPPLAEQQRIAGWLRERRQISTSIVVAIRAEQELAEVLSTALICRAVSTVE